MKAILIILALSLPTILNAQESCPCCTTNHQAFDFWIGDWEVKDANGKVVGYNLIEKHTGKCILNKNWTSAGANRGKSYNYFDVKDNTWNQVWIDNSGYSLVTKGAMVGKSIVLKSAYLTDEKGVKYANQIKWTPNNDGTITQLWTTVDEAGNDIATLFLGIYTKK